MLSIDGLQPEKGHETLYVVRELTQKRVWFAEPLISATADEVQRLIAKAKEWAASLNKPVGLWMSDKQDAFVTGIAAEFPGVPHRYCDNHFLRDRGQACAGGRQPRQGSDATEGARPAENRTSRAQAAECPGVDKPRTGRSHSNCDGDRGAGERACSRSRFGEHRGARLLRGCTWNSQ